MSRWLDRVARRAAGQPVAARDVPAAPTASESAATSRREFLKRAGVVGAAVWTVPVIDSALAPAAAASTPNCTGVCGGACPLCGPGQGTCTTNSQCASGLVCSGGVCKATLGATCTSNAQCSTNVCLGGTCQGTVAGTTCTSNNTCLSQTCINGVCQQSGTQHPWNVCASSADCYTNGGCNAATNTCNDSTAGGKCLNGADCASTLTCKGGNAGQRIYGTCG